MSFITKGGDWMRVHYLERWREGRLEQIAGNFTKEEVRELRRGGYFYSKRPQPEQRNKNGIKVVG